LGNPVDRTIHDFIVERFLYGDHSKPLGHEDSLLDKGVIDSTGVLELVTFLQSEFGIEIPDEEIIPDNLDSIAKLTRYVQLKQSRVTHAG
jgi:acyl carrier protein